MRSLTLCLLVVSLPLLSGCDAEIDNLPTTATPVPVTETFTGTLTVNGAQTHPVYNGATGTVTATLTSLGENAPEKVGISMGTLAGATCTVVLHNDNAVVTSYLSGTVSTLAGALCVRIFDVGKLTGPVEYTISVVHP
jgi:hypothetical protein